MNEFNRRLKTYLSTCMPNVARVPPNGMHECVPSEVPPPLNSSEDGSKCVDEEVYTDTCTYRCDWTCVLSHLIQIPLFSAKTLWSIFPSLTMANLFCRILWSCGWRLGAPVWAMVGLYFGGWHCSLYCSPCWTAWLSDSFVVCETQLNPEFYSSPVLTRHFILGHLLSSMVFCPKCDALYSYNCRK